MRATSHVRRALEPWRVDARAVRGAQDRSTCRFFFPWPCQAQQCYDANTERVALQRRLPADDQWVVSARSSDRCVLVSSACLSVVLALAPTS